jgi:hypothetical protein
MQPTKLLNQVSARPRALRRAPRYPRQVILIAAVGAMSAMACSSAAQHPVDPGGTVPYPYDPSNSTVHVASPPSRFAQPPPDEVVQPVEDDDGSDVLQPPGEAPMPYE